MMLCQDVHKLIEEHLAGTLDEPRSRAVVAHLRTCPSCHRAVEEARLATMVLRKAAELPPPPDLAANIKSAVRTRFLNRPRPLHERALGSPAFLATSASLLCGAIICLVAILRVGSVPLEPPPVRLVAQPVQVHSLVAVEPAAPKAKSAAAPHRSFTVREVVHTESPASLTQVTPRRALRARATPATSPREAAVKPRLPMRAAVHESGEEPAATLAPATQRISLPGVVEGLTTPTEDLPPADARFNAVDLMGATSGKGLQEMGGRH